MPDRHENTNTFIFLIGCPRSGTYLLTTLLNDYFPVAIPVETHFIPLFKKYLFLWGDLSKYKNRERLLSNIYDFLEIWTPRSEVGRDIKKIREYSLLCTKGRKSNIIKDCKSFKDMVTSLFIEFAKIHQKNLSGDKSAFFKNIPLQNLMESAHNAKFIHIIRDGRDVSLSWCKTWFGPLTVAESAELWRCHVENKRKWGRKNKNDYLEIKYEEIVKETEDVFKQISDFTGIIGKKFDSKSFSPSQMASILSEGGNHHTISSPPDKHQANKWPSNMKKADVELFEFIAGSTLSELGYPLSKPKLGAVKIVKFYLIIVHAKLLKQVSIRHFKLALKMILPIILCISSTLRIPAVRIINRRITKV